MKLISDSQLQFIKKEVTAETFFKKVFFIKIRGGIAFINLKKNNKNKFKGRKIFN